MNRITYSAEIQMNPPHLVNCENLLSSGARSLLIGIILLCLPKVKLKRLAVYQNKPVGSANLLSFKELRPIRDNDSANLSRLFKVFPDF